MHASYGTQCSPPIVWPHLVALFGNILDEAGGGETPLNSRSLGRLSSCNSEAKVLVAFEEPGTFRGSPWRLGKQQDPGIEQEKYVQHQKANQEQENGPGLNGKGRKEIHACLWTVSGQKAALVIAAVMPAVS